MSRPKASKKARMKPRTRARAGTKVGTKAKAKPEAKAKAQVRPGSLAVGRPPMPAKKTAPAARAVAAKRAASAGERPGSFEIEVEPSMSDLGVDRHPPAAPAPRRRSGRGSQANMADYPGESLTVGMEAPDFSLPGTQGQAVTLMEFRGRRVVLYFYPKDDTPGCTMEACAFRDALPRVQAKGAVVLGISLDDELSHQRFAEKYNLNFPLLSDKDAAVSRKYGTYKEKSLYGRSFWGIERTTFVIDREGKVEHVFRRVKVEGHAEEVMATLAG